MQSPSRSPIHEISERAAFWLHRWGPERAPVGVVALHGATSHGGWFEPFGHEMARHGIATFALDRRGSGQLRSLGVPATPEIWFEDLRCALEVVATHVERVVLLPWCFSVRLVVPALTAGVEVDRTILLAPAFRFSERAGARRARSVDAGAEEFPIAIDLEDFVETPAASKRITDDPLRWVTMSRRFARMSNELGERTERLWPALQHDVSVVIAMRDRLVDFEHTRTMVGSRGFHAVELDAPHGFFLDDPAGAADVVAPLALR